MIRLSQKLLDAGVQADTRLLAEALAESSFGRHGYYGVMPRDLRLLLAEAGLRTARQHGVTATEPAALFVQAMVDMSPRFWAFEPFRAILADPRRDEHRKMEEITADAMAPYWDQVVAHLQAHEDWHLDHWDACIDWTVAKVRA